MTRAGTIAGSTAPKGVYDDARGGCGERDGQTPNWCGARYGADVRPHRPHLSGSSRVLFGQHHDRVDAAVPTGPAQPPRAGSAAWPRSRGTCTAAHGRSSRVCGVQADSDSTHPSIARTGVHPPPPVLSPLSDALRVRLRWLDRYPLCLVRRFSSLNRPTTYRPDDSLDRPSASA